MTTNPCNTSNYKYVTVGGGGGPHPYSASENKSIKVYPNPINDELEIEVNTKENDKDREVRIYNLLTGKVVIQSKKNRINISSLPKGTYIIEVIVNGTRETQKIIKK